MYSLPRCHFSESHDVSYYEIGFPRDSMYRVQCSTLAMCPKNITDISYLMRLH
jgi:hypothetical protein